ncbi:MAG: hypothetical protein FJW34_02035 [Acidobacteria bacterium]|nr:hypothetical protein [Acidobacteriota bacterium]
MFRIFKVISGFLLIVVGLILSIPGVPGPGLVLVVLGLVILSKHFHWAGRILEWGKARFEGAMEKAKGKRHKAKGRSEAGGQGGAA